nr:MFS transporter [Sporolactobacillus vineae]
MTGLTAIVVGSVMPQLLSFYEVSYTVGGQLIFVGAMGFLVGVLITSWLNNRFPPKPLLAIAASIIAFAQFGILALPPLPVVMILYFINSIGSSSIGIVVATLFLEVFTGRQAVAMSYLEVSFGLGAFSMPLLASTFIALDIWRFLFLITAVLAVFLAVLSTRISISQNGTDSSARPLDASGAGKQIPLTPGRKMLTLVLFGLAIFLYGGLEGSLNNFMSSIFMNYLHLVAYYASVSVGIFWASMVIGRALTGVIIRKVTYKKYLLTNICGAILSLILFILLKNVLLGYFFVATLGLMLSGIYSITLVFANFSIPNSAHLVTPVISGLCGLGMALLPAFTGFSLDHAGMAATLWYIVAIACFYLTFLILINRIRGERSFTFFPRVSRKKLRARSF